MNNKTTSYKRGSFLLGLIVLLFTFKVGIGSFENLITNSVANINNDSNMSHSLDSIAESDKVNNFDVNIKEMKKPNVSSFLLMDLDDLEFSFSASLSSSTRICFFQDIILKYSSFVYRNVKLFLFYSSIKIPLVSL